MKNPKILLFPLVRNLKPSKKCTNSKIRISIIIPLLTTVHWRGQHHHHGTSSCPPGVVTTTTGQVLVPPAWWSKVWNFLHCDFTSKFSLNTRKWQYSKVVKCPLENQYFASYIVIAAVYFERICNSHPMKYIPLEVVLHRAELLVQ